MLCTGVVSYMYQDEDEGYYVIHFTLVSIATGLPCTDRKLSIQFHILENDCMLPGLTTTRTNQVGDITRNACTSLELCNHPCPLVPPSESGDY